MGLFTYLKEDAVNGTSSISYSDDGLTYAYGNPILNNNKGKVYVKRFNNQTSSWYDLVGGSILEGTIGSTGDFDSGYRFGNFVSLSSDGNRLLVHSIRSDKGRIDIFDWDNNTSTWSNIFNVEGANNLVKLGNRCVVISPNGNHFALSSNTSEGTNVHIYSLKNGSWTNTLFAVNTRDNNSCVFSSDGNTFFLGNIATVSNPGTGWRYNVGQVRVWRYNLLNNNWSEKATIANPDNNDSDNFGFRIKCSSDGNMIAISAPGADVIGKSNCGKVYIYTTSNDWTSNTKRDTIVGNNSNSGLGNLGLDLSSDGTMLAIGSASYNSILILGNSNNMYSQILLYSYNNSTNVWEEVSLPSSLTWNYTSNNIEYYGTYLKIYNNNKNLLVSKNMNGNYTTYFRIDKIETYVELRSTGLTPSQLKSAGYPVSDLKKAGFTASELKGVYSINELKVGGFTVSEVKAAEFLDSEILNAGFPVSQLRIAGYSINQVKNTNIYQDSEILAGGYSINQLISVDYNLTQLKTVFTLAQLKAQFTLAQLKAEFTLAQLKAEFTLPQLKAEFTLAQLKVEFTLAQLKAEFTLPQLKAEFTLPQLKAEFTLAQLKVEFTLAQLKVEFTLAQLKLEGFTVNELKTEKFTAKQLRDNTFPDNDILNAGFLAGQLKEAGFNASQLKAVYYTASQLKIGGFTASELKNANFTAIELKNADFTKEQLLSALFTKQELIIAGFTFSLENVELKSLSHYTSPISAKFTHSREDLSVLVNIEDNRYTKSSGASYAQYTGHVGVVTKFSVTATNTTNSQNENNFSNEPINVELTLPMANPNSSPLKLFKVDPTVFNNPKIINSDYPVTGRDVTYNATTGKWSASLPSLSTFIIVDPSAPSGGAGGDPHVQTIHGEHHLLPNDWKLVKLYEHNDMKVVVKCEHIGDEVVEQLHKLDEDRNVISINKDIHKYVTDLTYMTELVVLNKNNEEVFKMDLLNDKVLLHNDQEDEQSEVKLEKLEQENEEGLFSLTHKRVYPKQNLSSYLLHLDSNNIMKVQIDNFWDDINFVKLHLFDKEHVEEYSGEFFKHDEENRLE